MWATTSLFLPRSVSQFVDLVLHAGKAGFQEFGGSDDHVHDGSLRRRAHQVLLAGNQFA